VPTAFPTLPPISAEEYRRFTKKQRADRHTLEIAEGAKLFNALQSLGIDIFEAAERVPVPRANRGSAKQSKLRNLYQQPLVSQH
jgi:hypothetical protein